MNIRKLLVLVGDDAEEAKKFFPDSVSMAEPIGQKEFDAAIESVKTFPVELGEHHVRHFFTKINRGSCAVGRYVGKKLADQTESVDYFLNTIAKNSYGENFSVKHFIKEFEYYKNGVYSVTATPDEANILKREFGKDVVLIWVSKEPTDKQFDVKIAVTNKSKMKKDLLLSLEKLNERWGA